MLPLAERFYRWYWHGWYEHLPSGHWALKVVPWVESHFDDEALGNVVAARWICPRLGPDIHLDMCGRPEHAYCVRCNGICS